MSVRMIKVDRQTLSEGCPLPLEVFDDVSVSQTTLESDSMTNDIANEHIKVCVRIRPLLRDEMSTEVNAWVWDQNTITQDKTNSQRKSSVIGISGRTLDDPSVGLASYSFDHLFKPEHTNQHIFSSVVQNIVERSMQGFHGSVFSYGQTSSGKTFTMNGTASQPGIIPQAIHCCFDMIQSFPDREFLFRVSYMEVYNEQVKDLLSTEPTQIKIQYAGKVGNILSGVKEQVVLNPQQIISLLKAGEAQRHVGSTDMNEKSSRAHTLFKLIIESKERQSTTPATPSTSSSTSSLPTRVSTLSLVDLAGSENAKMTNSTGERAKEAKYINTSLLTLSTIIQRLSEERPGSMRTQHLPYRDSKLTRLMQPSLSGNAYIAIICTISPTLRCSEETHNTLKFAARAKKVRMDAKINETQDDKTLLQAYRQEIESLKAKLSAMESQSPAVGGAAGGGDEMIGRGSAAEPGLEEEDEQDLLQMIESIERLILKPDASTVSQLSRFLGESMGGGGGSASEKRRPTMGSSNMGTPDDGGNQKYKVSALLDTGKLLTPLGPVSPSAVKHTNTAASGNSSNSGTVSMTSSTASSSSKLLGTKQAGSVAGGKSSPGAAGPARISVAASSGAPGKVAALVSKIGASSSKLIVPKPSGLKAPTLLSTGGNSGKTTAQSTVRRSLGVSVSSSTAAASTSSSSSSSSVNRLVSPTAGGVGVDRVSKIGSGSGHASKTSQVFLQATNVISGEFGISSDGSEGVVEYCEREGVEREELRYDNGLRADNDSSTEGDTRIASDYDAVGPVTLQLSSDDGDKVLLTVSHLLAMLKAQVTKITPKRRGLHVNVSAGDGNDVDIVSPGRNNSVSPGRSDSVSPGRSDIVRSGRSTDHSFDRTMPVNLAEAMMAFPSPLTSPHSPDTPVLGKLGSASPSPPSSPSGKGVVSSRTAREADEAKLFSSFEMLENSMQQKNDQIDRLQLELRLKEADNKFLQDQLEQKNNTLAMLTEGLREVEIAQETWVEDNSRLIGDLNRLGAENELLRAEVSRLQRDLERQQEQLFAATGLEPEPEEF